MKNPCFIPANNDTNKPEEQKIEYLVPPHIKDLKKTGLTAKWIWTDVSRPKMFADFVRLFSLDTLPETAEAVIAADSKYILWINGEKAVFEGGLKRGFAPDGSYCDTVNVAPYLKTGENRIAVTVCYFGQNGYSHCDSGHGGFLFDCPSLDVYSDGSWKTRENPCCSSEEEAPYLPNCRLAEFNINYDAAKSDGDIFDAGYGVSDWKNATVVCNAGEKPFGDLYDRIIPLFTDYGLKAYINDGEFNGVKHFSDRIAKMKMPYNCHLFAYLEINAPAGKTIDIYTDRYSDKNGYSIKMSYTTAKGKQSYETPFWINGETVYYHIPKGVEVIRLAYRETGYASSFAGSFACDDDLINVLYEKSRRTLYVTMRDTFMDCPDRERSQWYGDAVNEAELCYYSMDGESYKLIKKGILTMLAWQHADGVLQTVVPDKMGCFELPLQNLAGIVGFWKYYRYTGDSSLIEDCFKASVRYLSLWKMQENGLVEHRGGSWDWPDWGTAADMPVLENAWFRYAVTATAEMGKLINSEAVPALEKLSELLKKNINHYFFDGTAYTSGSGYDDRANAVIVCSHLADKENYGGILNAIMNSSNSSPYMEKYVLEALCIMGRADKARERMAKRYFAMANDSSTTLWEFWDADEGTKNHAWSGGPLVIAAKYFAGISPVTPGWKNYIISPEYAGLKRINCTVPSPVGNISVFADYRNDCDRYTLTLPCKGGVAAVRSGEEIYIGDTKAVLEPKKETKGVVFLMESDGKCYFTLPEGSVRITVGKKKQNGGN